ncbi:hypothetical protein TNCV_4671221 [Trichonephila clavipes]|nr:hypothetical protein TNCV_4671221 [Trichonephila clavipes]
MPDRTAGLVRLQTRVRWSSLRLNRDSSLKMTRLQSVTPAVRRGRQNPVDTAYDVVSGKRLSGLSGLANFGQSSHLWFMMALDVWKEVSGVESML